MQNGIENKDWLVFIPTFRMLYDAGETALDAFYKTMNVVTNYRFRALLKKVYAQMQEGERFSDALKKYPSVCPVFFPAIIKAGEESGDLSKALKEVERYIRWSDDINMKINRAVRSPIILLILIVLVSLVILNFVAPQIILFLDGKQVGVPFFTETLLSFAHFLDAYGMQVIGIPILVWVGGTALRQIHPVFAKFFDYLYSVMPVSGKLYKDIALSRFLAVLSMLLSSNVRFDRALEIAKEATGNHYLAARFEKSVKEIEMGNDITGSLAASGLFSESLMRVFALGEEYGHLETRITEMSAEFSDRLAKRIDDVVSVVEPSLSVVMGAIIFWIVFAVIAPIYQSLGMMTP